MSTVQTTSFGGWRSDDHKVKMEGTDHLNIRGKQSVGSNGQIAIPRGTTAQRPANPVAGMIRYDTDLERVQIYDGTDWVDQTTTPGQDVADDSIATVGPFDLPEAYLSLINAASAAGTLFYVDQAGGGNDLNDGRSPETAFASISRAVEASTDGYTIYVMPGIHVNMNTTYLREGRSYGHGILDDYGKHIVFVGMPGKTVLRCTDTSEIGYPHTTNGGDSYRYNATYGPYPGGMINANSRAIGFIVESHRPGNTNAVAGQTMFSQDAGGYTNPSGLRGIYLNCVFRNTTTVAGDGTYNNGTTYAFQFDNGVFEAPFTGNNYRTGNSGCTMSAVGYTRDAFPTSGMGSIDQQLITLDSKWRSSVGGYGVYEGSYAWDANKVIDYPGATTLCSYAIDGVAINATPNELDGSRPERAATSASALKTVLATTGRAKNGSYWYKFSDGAVYELWTDFETYAPLNFVMVTRVNNGSQDQWKSSGINESDLMLQPNTTNASRVSKLPDTYMNEMVSANSIRWAIMGNGSTFYRLDDNPKWYSNHGQASTCTYTHGFYSAYATPASSPQWDTTFDTQYEACGGLHDGEWLTLTGIHTNDGTYFGGYSGANSARATPPGIYGGLGGSNNQWSMHGWVLLQW
jgi:hypothetical protein